MAEKMMALERENREADEILRKASAHRNDDTRLRAYLRGIAPAVETRPEGA